jgi:hypothetical protein
MNKCSPALASTVESPVGYLTCSSLHHKKVHLKQTGKSSLQESLLQKIKSIKKSIVKEAGTTGLISRAPPFGFADSLILAGHRY